jgi:uncharacterized protein YutE (UPF0331/DUF86 family)
MSPGKASKRVIADRIQWIDKMVSEIRALPLDHIEAFASDARNVYSAESCLRRALEALFDLGRHILAKSFGRGVSEYKQIARELEMEKVLAPNEGQLLKTLAGYRNRMIHFYHEITTKELHEICRGELDDLLLIRNAYLRLAKENPERLDETL